MFGLSNFVVHAINYWEPGLPPDPMTVGSGFFLSGSVFRVCLLHHCDPPILYFDVNCFRFFQHFQYL